LKPAFPLRSVQYYAKFLAIVSGDSSLNPDDFFPAAWKSFQWDRGIWALPANLTPQILIYHADAFDKAGLAYPNENWTLDDFAHAAHALAVQDAQGKVTIPGFYGLGGKTQALQPWDISPLLVFTASDVRLNAAIGCICLPDVIDGVQSYMEDQKGI
jgi:ABC-type glycerol-3-phosphate transport system substrate-binding protein